MALETIHDIFATLVAESQFKHDECKGEGCRCDRNGIWNLELNTERLGRAIQQEDPEAIRDEIRLFLAEVARFEREWIVGT